MDLMKLPRMMPINECISYNLQKLIPVNLVTIYRCQFQCITLALEGVGV